MELQVGAIVEGKVTGITKFGAFIQLSGGGSGLVHISEIANVYVNDVHDHVAIGDEVKVKILAIHEGGKINLSIKQALPPAPKPAYAPRPVTSYRPTSPSPRVNQSSSGELHGPSEDSSFEDKLKHFMRESDSRMNGNKLYADRKNSGRRRK